MKLLLLIMLPVLLSATETFVISDYDYTNQDYTFQQIWKLNKSFKKSALNYDNVETIVRYCTVYTINPIIVLARLQFESDLLYRAVPKLSLKWLKHRAMGYRLIYSIRRDGIKMYKYGGFDIQVYKGIELMRKYFDR